MTLVLAGFVKLNVPKSSAKPVSVSAIVRGNG